MGVQDLRDVGAARSTTRPLRVTLARSFGAFAADIKLFHSVFALPFAMAAFVVAKIPFPGVAQIALLLLCMVTARSFAMGMNRFLDRDIDKVNPRTVGRMIPNGALSPAQSLGWSLLAAAVFVAGAFGLSPLAGLCAVPLLGILMSYSYMKHLSWLTHWYLGVCLGLAPIAVQIALQGAVSLPIVLMGMAVAFWTAGFDILYSLQDIDFDRSKGLRSVPARFGPASALWLSRLSFVAMVALLVATGTLTESGPLYFAGVLCVGGILTYEHLLVRDAKETGRSQHINVAFFNANALVSVLFLAFAVIDALLRA